ncbi:hypothetical protein K469DRAFT_117452 [Zopfia rhizophila CBS 207.26]|uniref:Uncharacterized protein n=1 Tax=Zopfia rhizophila CBS 207.26 TaxID=1314779 RepID=A0A6A6EAE6_9PEZI|nr:hypothetical protein K469DRAFT_117452 [Zopfia rhizophila CBS 207.26]
MSALNPTGPSQPTQSQAYTTPGNPSTKNLSESTQTAFSALDYFKKVDQRIPIKQASEDQAIASSLGQGIHGAGAGEEAKGLSEEDVGRHKELDAEQMAAPGEGRVAEAREAVKQHRGQGVDVGGDQVQQGGAANPGALV